MTAESSSRPQACSSISLFESALSSLSFVLSVLTAGIVACTAPLRTSPDHPLMKLNTLRPDQSEKQGRNVEAEEEQRAAGKKTGQMRETK